MSRPEPCRRPRARVVLVLGLVLGWASPAAAQLAVRPGSSRDHPFDTPWDLSGRSLKAPRVRSVHDGGTTPGSSVWLIRHDPLLAYAIGRDLNLRDWMVRDGVFGETGKLAGFTKPRIMGGGGGGVVIRDDTASCAVCHAVPFGEMGAGITIPKDSGTGRNTPHLYGGGLIEMIGERIRAEILTSCDADRDGRITPGEAHGRRATVRTGPRGDALDFGACGDESGDGVPDINGQVRAFYLDGQGTWVPWATSLHTASVAGWSPEPQVFGHAQFDGALTATLRGFFVAAADVHEGLQAFDPLLVDDPDGDGLAGVSPNGMRQFVTVRPRDRGRVRSGAGVSRDDPDRDGFLEELSCGDVDLAEHFLLHIPPPAQQRSARAAPGRARFEALGCGTCHVSTWTIERDRRLFRLEVAPGPDGALTGTLVWQVRKTGHGLVPQGAPFTVEGVYSDFRKHDMGAAFEELGFDGIVNRRWRTPPLWGVGTSAPYGHDGASLSLEEVIARHDGEAAAAAQAFRALDENAREDLLAFLRSLVLYPVTGLPADIDGDGRIAQAWQVGGRPTGGPERFDPELLAQVPCAIEGPTRGYGGEQIFSKACLNVDTLYRMDLVARRDSDRDGFPDVRDDCPAARGFLDGCRDPVITGE